MAQETLKATKKPGLWRIQNRKYDAPFSASAMSRFRQRITPEMLAWVNDYIVGRPEEKNDDNSDDDHPGDSKTE